MPCIDATGEEKGPNLPEGGLIEQAMQARLQGGKPLAVLFVDLAKLEAYNSEYGWTMGERIVRMLATTIADVASERGGKDDVVGHIWGAQFVVLSTPDRAESIAQEIIKRFDASIPQYYSRQVRDRHYLDGSDRRINPIRALLASVAIAIVTNEDHPLEHTLQIEELAAEVIRYIKSWPGSNYAFDRRLR